MVNIRGGCTALAAAAGAGGVVLVAPAIAQQSVAINLAGVRIQHNINETRSSAPATISPAHQYHYEVAGMVRGTGLFTVMSLLFPTPTPLAQVLETLAPGSSEFLTGDFWNCPGTHPILPPPQTIAGQQVVSGVNVTYAITISFSINASGVASFSLTNVVLQPSLVGGLIFDSGQATLTRVDVCIPNCDESTTAPILNVADFSCFLTRYAAGDLRANCDCSTTEPTLNVQDFGCFLTKYAQGCP